ncbi:MAG: hypothetical protein ACK5QW_06155 [Cyanobacteriota bacterium]
MPAPPERDDLHQRYDVIEKAYCEGRWSLVIEAGTTLLRELSDRGDGPGGTALVHRTQLLIAHTLLHGYGDREAAEDVYEAVRQGGAEPALRQIAEEGLDQCHEPLPSPLGDEEPEEAEGAAVATRPQLFLPEEERSDPEDGGAGLASAKAGAGLSYRPRLQRATTVVGSEPAPVREPAQPSPAGEGAGQAGTAERSGAAPGDLGLAADPFRPSSGPAPVPVDGAEAPVMPWLAGPPPGQAGAGVVPDPPWLAAAGNSAPAGPMALVPDVVEEPELLEVHQASPSLAEEVELMVNTNAAARSDPRAGRDGDADLRACLLRVRID